MLSFEGQQFSGVNSIVEKLAVSVLLLMKERVMGV